MDTSGRTVATIPLDGGHLALDFVNTVGGLRDDPPSTEEELFDSYEDVATWCARVGVISERQAGTLRAGARRDEPAARRALRAAIELRDDVLYPIFRALADGDEPSGELLERLRDEERKALADARLVRESGARRNRELGAAFRWTWPPPRDLTDPLRPILHSALELLTAGPVERVKTCGNCRWLFLDQSRNRSRRWCSMDECGIEMKHARFMERRRVSRSSTAAASAP